MRLSWTIFYQHSSGRLSQNAALGNQFASLINRLNGAKGRVKAVITVRKNVFAGVLQHTRLNQSTVRRLIVEITDPQRHTKEAVLESHLRTHLDYLREKVLPNINTDAFEDLLHVAEFARQITQTAPEDPREIQDIFEDSRPSAYKYWIKRQPEPSRVLMYVLLAVSQTNHFVWPEDLARIFDIAVNCTNRKSESGIGDLYSQTLADVKNRQERIQKLPNGSLDFVHPRLSEAIMEFLEREEPGAFGFVRQLVGALTSSDNPLDQSVAVWLILKYHDRLDGAADFVVRLSASQYVQVRNNYSTRQ